MSRLRIRSLPIDGSSRCRMLSTMQLLASAVLSCHGCVSLAYNLVLVHVGSAKSVLGAAAPSLSLDACILVRAAPGRPTLRQTRDTRRSGALRGPIVPTGAADLIAQLSQFLSLRLYRVVHVLP